MKNSIYRSLILVVSVLLLFVSCLKEGHVAYRFEVKNATSEPMTVYLSSWGDYKMYINGIYDSKYKFHDMEIIQPHSSLIFSIVVGDDPNPSEIPATLIPAWGYISSIEYDNIKIDKEYFRNKENWKIDVIHQINGTFTQIELVVAYD